MTKDLFEIATPLDLREMLESVPRIEKHDGRLALVKVSHGQWMVYLAGLSWNLLNSPTSSPIVYSDFLVVLNVFLELDEALRELADARDAAALVMTLLATQ